MSDPIIPKEYDVLKNMGVNIFISKIASMRHMTGCEVQCTLHKFDRTVDAGFYVEEHDDEALMSIKHRDVRDRVLEGLLNYYKTNVRKIEALQKQILEGEKP